jgi:hypothetical protein
MNGPGNTDLAAGRRGSYERLRAAHRDPPGGLGRFDLTDAFDQPRVSVGSGVLACTCEIELTLDGELTRCLCEARLVLAPPKDRA